MMRKVLSLIFMTAFFSLTAQEKAENLPYSFIINKGQWPAHIKYKAEIDGQTTVYFEDRSIHYQIVDIPHAHPDPVGEDERIKGHIFNAVFLNSNREVEHKQEGASNYHYNYYLGKDRSKWRGNVKLYQKINYQNLYNGIDLISYQEDGHLKYDYLIKAGHDPGQIKIAYEGVETPQLVDGSLIIQHQLGQLIEGKPFAYQLQPSGEKEVVRCNYSINPEGEVGFDFPEGYDSSRDLIIDPELIFSTYSGSKADNFGMTATFDREGNGYMGGVVWGIGYQTTSGAFDTTFNSGTIDIAISKFSSDSMLLYSTYLGGNRNEAVHSLVVNDSLQLFLLGVTNSNNYPITANAYDTAYNNNQVNITTDVTHNFPGGTDIIVSKFSEDGDRLLASTYYGGNSLDGVNSRSSGNSTYDRTVFNYGDGHRGEIVLDSSGFCYIGSSSRSTNLNAINSITGDQDGIVVKFKPDLDSVVWARYHGGDKQDAIYSLKVIKGNRVLVGGGTVSNTKFPITSNAHITGYKGGITDGFISIISADGSRIENSTYIGTSSYDQVYFVEFDRFGNVYGFGQTANDNFPIKNSSIANKGAGQFFIKLNSTLDSVIMSTTFGADSAINISPTAFLVDRCLNIYASGWGARIVPDEGTKILNNNMPLTADAFRSNTSNSDFYLYVINGAADSVIYASFFGGTTSDDHVDGGTSRFDRNGIIYQSVCASCFGSKDDFPTKNAVFDEDGGPNCNNAIFKMDFQILPVARFIVDQDEFCLNEATNDTIPLTITNQSQRSDITTWNFNGIIFNSEFKDTTIFITRAGNYFIRQEVEDTICAAGDFTETIVRVRPDNIELNFNTDTLICQEDSFLLRALSQGKANTFEWSDQPDFNNLFPSSDSTLKVKINPGDNWFYVRAGNDITNACEKVDSVNIKASKVDFTPSISSDTICEQQEVEFSFSGTNIDRFQWDFDNGILDTSSRQRTVSYSSSGNFTIKLVVENKVCKLKDSALIELKVEENKLLLSDLTDTLSCGANPLQLDLNSFGTADRFLWSSKGNFSDTLNNFPFDSSLSFNQTDSMQVFAKISDRFCERTDSLVAEYVEYELNLQSIVDSSCAPFSMELQTTIVGTDSFRINLGNGNFTTSDPTPLVEFPNEGTFTISLIGSNAKCGIKDTLTETIVIFPEARLEPFNDTSFCLGDSITLLANTFGSAENFIWSRSSDFNNPLNPPTDSTLRISPNSSTKFFFKTENIFCEAIDSLIVAPDSVAIDLADFESICLDDTLNIEVDVLHASTPLVFRWQPEDSLISGQNSREIRLAPKEDMQINLIATDLNGCEERDTMQIEVNVPNFTDAEILTSLDTAFEGQRVEFTTNRNGSELVYFWEPDQDFDNPNAPTTSLRAKESKQYRVTITDLSTTCEVIAFRELTVFEINCGEPDIFVPSAFTPNQDLTNDILFVRGDNLESIEFQLFNRWGEKVFETNDKDRGWDGTYQGKEVDPGVFVYHLKAICFDGQEFIKKGNITLIR